MKRIIEMLLSAVMVIGLAAHGQKADTAAPAATVQETTAQAAATTAAQAAAAASSDEWLPLVKNGESKTITVGIQNHPWTEDYETNDYTKFIEEKTGINLDFVYFSQDNEEADQQLALMIASGEKLPDVLINFRGLGLNAVNEYGRDGYFIDLKPYYDTCGHYVLNSISELSETMQANYFAYGVDPESGKYYAFPLIQEEPLESMVAIEMINKDWLKAVGAEMPTTVDELYEVLKKFATEDPNGNGIADEIPAIGSTEEYRTDITQFLINAYVYCNDSYFFNATDGKLWVPYTTDEYREAMKYLNKLGTEGLLSTLTFTMPAMDAYTELRNMTTPDDGPVLCGVTSGHPELNMTAGNEASYQWETLAPLKAETDKGGYGNFYEPSYDWCNFITCDCQDPELAFKLFDFMCSPEAFWTNRYGTRGVDYDIVENGVDVSGLPAKIKVLSGDVWSTQNNKSWHMIVSTLLLSGSNKDGSFRYVFEDDGSWASFAFKLLGSEYAAWTAIDQPKELVYTLVYNSEEAEKVGKVQDMIKQYVKEARALFTTGALDPNNDADWNTYLNNLETQGLSTYLDCAQAAYTRMNQ